MFTGRLRLFSAAAVEYRRLPKQGKKANRSAFRSSLRTLYPGDRLHHSNSSEEIMPHRRTSINTKSWATAIAVSGIVLVSIIGYFLLQTVFIEGSLFPYGEDSWRHYSTGGTFYTTAPSISPDCASVAFSSPATGHSDIYLYERSSEESHRITSTDDFESAPHFVDGGKRIAYVRESKRCRHIWIIDPRTRQTKQVTFGDVLDDILAVSNDGSHILLMRSDVTIGLGRSVDFHLLNIKDLNTTPLGVGSFAALSASGRLVAYTPRGVINEIWILDRETGERSFACQADSAAFSPDERFLVASRAGQQWELDRDIWLVPLDGDAPLLLGRGHSFAFTCDSEAVLFYVGYENEIWMVNINDRSKRKIEAPVGHKTALRISNQCCLASFTVLAAESSSTPKNFILDYEKETFIEF